MASNTSTPTEAPPRPAIPLVSRHDTWVSIDPILGCPASCSYCYLNAHALTATRPVSRASPRETVDALDQYLAGAMTRRWGGERDPVPICIGNHTDMLMSPTGTGFLLEYLALHAQRLPEHPVVIITKARLDGDVVDGIDAVGHPVLLFLSQSFANAAGLPGIERGAVSRPADTVRNAELLAGRRNVRALHFWRPVTRRTVPDVEAACRMLRPLRDAGVVASVAIGLKSGPFLSARADDNRALLGDASLPERGEHLPAEVEARVLEAGRLLGHPVYRQTSCAVARALGRPEALGSWRPGVRAKRCEPCHCPGTQRSLCDHALEADLPPSPESLLELARSLGLDAGRIRWDDGAQALRIDTVLDQELHTVLTHWTGVLVIPARIRPTRAWIGSLGVDPMKPGPTPITDDPPPRERDER